VADQSEPAAPARGRECESGAAIIASPTPDVGEPLRLALRARREAPSLPASESELLLRVNDAIPIELQSRYAELIARRRDELLTPAELEELLGLTDEIERLEARRVAALAELARLRRLSLEELMGSLGISSAIHDE
jgi:hypothetical protein